MSASWIRMLMLGAFVASGCQTEEQACDEVKGMYLATYTYVDGNCTPTLGTAGPYDMTSDRSTATTMQMRVDDMITTEVVKRGCTVDVTRMATKEGKTLWMVQGSLDVESSDVLSGALSRYEWMDGMQLCQGTYETVLERQQLPGSAASF